MSNERIFIENVLVKATDTCRIGNQDNLTIGKEYPIVKSTSDESQFCILNDHNEPHWFGADRYTDWFERLKNDTAPSPSAPENTGSPFHLPLTVVDGQIRDAFGNNVVSRFPYDTNAEHKQYMVTAVNSYSTLKADNEEKDNQLKYCHGRMAEAYSEIEKLKAENEAKENRIQELECELKYILIEPDEEDFERYPLPICFEPREELKELNLRKDRINRDYEDWKERINALTPKQ